MTSLALIGGCTINVGTQPAASNATETAAPAPLVETAPNVAPPASWADIIEETQTGVVQVFTTRCDNLASGTAFLIDPRVLVTAAHVVADAVRVDLVLGSQHASASVMGIDEAGDIALLRSDTDLQGYGFDLSPIAPRKGDEITGLGYPLDADTVVATKGQVSGLAVPVDVPPIHRGDMIQTDAGINPGNSGGPIVTIDGQVVGIVSAANRAASVTAWAVPAAAVAPQIAAWREARIALPSLTCRASAPAPEADIPSQPFSPIIQVSTLDPGARQVADLMSRHGSAINAGAYDDAFADFTPTMQEYVGSADSFGAGLNPVFWLGANVIAVETRDDGALLADVAVDRIGDPAVGGACYTWTKHYVIKTIDGNPRLRIGWVEDTAPARPCS